MALASGECDAYYNYANPIEATLIDSFTGMDGLDMGESPFAGSYQMLFGCSRTPGDDVNFRQAIAYAIDYPTAATAINGEYGKPANRGVLGPSFKGFDDSIAMLEYNAETAKSMLDAAGYVDADGDGWRERRTAARWICPSFRSIPAAWKSAPVWAKSSASPSRMSA